MQNRSPMGVPPHLPLKQHPLHSPLHSHHPPAPASPPSSSSSSSPPPPALAFLGENWKIVLGTVVFGAVAAGVYYALFRSSSSSPKTSESPKESGKSTTKETSAEAQPHSQPKEKPVSELTPEEKAERAKKIKEKGNKYFSGKHFEKAIELYTEALELVPNSSEAAVFYSNRAACYSNMGLHDLVIRDCDSALALDRKYVKALNRRALAYEQQHRLKEALIDLTAACILDGFKNETAMRNADRIVKLLGTKSAEEFFPKRTIRLPPAYFINAYFDSYSNKFESQIEDSVEEEKGGDAKYREVVEKLKVRDYEDIDSMVDEALSLDTNFKSQALNLRGTLKYLKGDYDGAISDLSDSISITSNSNTLIKRASVKFEKKEIEQSLADFELAVQANPENCDVYYHRGQAFALTGNIQGAIDSYQKSISLNPDSPIPRVQLAVVYFRAQSIQMSLQTFKESLERFPDYGDLYNYYGEVLTEIQNLDDAMKNFDIAASKNPENPLSLINKAFLMHRFKEDVEGAITLLKKAITIDPHCELAFAHLGQLYIQQSKLDEAIQAYQQAIECSRTEQEIAQWFSCIEAAAAQLAVFGVYPELKPPAPSS